MGADHAPGTNILSSWEAIESTFNFAVTRCSGPQDAVGSQGGCEIHEWVGGVDATTHAQRLEFLNSRSHTNV